MSQADRSSCPHCGHLHVFPVDRDACARDSRDRGRMRTLVVVCGILLAIYMVTEMVRARRAYGTWRCAFHDCSPISIEPLPTRAP